MSLILREDYMKTCNKCGIVKPLNEFNKSKLNSDKHDGTCRQCRKIIWKERTDRMTNEQITKIENSGLYKICSICKTKKVITEYPLDRSLPDGHKARCISCNKIKMREYANNRSPRIGRKDYNAKYHADELIQKKTSVITYYGGGKCACVRCGFSDLRALTIDHINGHGNQHRKENHTHTGLHFYKWLISNSYPSGFRTLCGNCQSIVEHERRDSKRGGF